MELKLEHGRPESTEGRLPREVRVYDYLDALGIDYDRLDHEAAFTMEACEAFADVLGIEDCKNLFLCNRQQTDFYLLMMPGNKPFKTKEITKQIGSARLSFAGPDRMLEFLDIEPGSLSVMGLMNDREHRVQLLVDEDVLKLPFVGCHPCVNTASLKLKTEDVFGRFTEATGHGYKTVHLVGE